MRALTVRQPWAWAIMHGGKTVENRTRNLAGSYRGPVAITSALGADVDALTDPAIIIAVALRRLFGPDERMASNSPHGVVLGVVDLVDVHVSKQSTTLAQFGKPMYFDNETPIGELCSSWANFVRTGVYHLVLANPRPLPTPIPVRGRLGLWTLPDDVAAQVEEALR